MKKEVEYHEVTVTFVVSEREAQRVTEETSTRAVRDKLAQMITNAISDNATNSMDVEDVVVAIDGKVI
jgi:hypothetical protein